MFPEAIKEPNVIRNERNLEKTITRSQIKTLAPSLNTIFNLTLSVASHGTCEKKMLENLTLLTTDLFATFIICYL